MDKKRPISWKDLHEIYLMQMKGYELRPETAAEAGERIVSEMRHELHQLMDDVLKGRQS